MEINELVKKAHNDAKEKGWWDKGKVKSRLECMVLLHSEISEAVEEFRKGATPTYWERNIRGELVFKGWMTEMADIVIRVADFVGSEGQDLERVILKKMEFNKTRPYRHGNKKY